VFEHNLGNVPSVPVSQSWSPQVIDCAFKEFYLRQAPGLSPIFLPKHSPDAEADQPRHPSRYEFLNFTSHTDKLALMRIETVTLFNFQSFGHQSSVISLMPLTAFIGANGSGKTAALKALSRLFGTSASERQIRRSDFHVDPRESIEDMEECSLYIEARIAFPELENDSGGEQSVPHVFKNMIISDSEKPICRIRLEATYIKGILAEGSIEEHIFWITSASDEITEEHKLPLRAYQRDLIQTIYLPAARDPERQLYYASGSLLYRLLAAAKWTEKPATQAEEYHKKVAKAFSDEAAIKQLNNQLKQAWGDLNYGNLLGDPTLTFGEANLQDLLKRVKLVFSEAALDIEREVALLSDGWRSLLYFAIIQAVFEIEQGVLQSEPKDANFSRDDLKIPALTIFAVEEPENHLAPQYLGRIMKMLRSTVSYPAQIILTSHSASIMSRVEVEEVRHFKLNENRYTAVSQIAIPPEKTEEYKFVTAAVRHFPELYFARVVVLGEGESESIVIPRICTALDVDLDPNFISVVPLGGRHVNHLWRLLNSLSIPFITLLDADWNRKGAGWGRIKYCLQQLIQIGFTKIEILTVVGEKGGKRVLTDDELAKMHTWNLEDQKSREGWLAFLESYNIFFCMPLDLDLLMFQAFPMEYKAVSASGLNIPNTSQERESYFKQVLATVVGSHVALEDYDETSRIELAWYRRLFLGMGKPVVHLSALSRLNDTVIQQKCPAVLGRMTTAIKKHLDKK
jgi:putative ATP-dependent endonuclease of OLD family